jgi:hypothetical protein
VLDEPKRVMTHSSSTQREKETVQETVRDTSISMLATALFQIEKTIESSIGKMVSAIEWNSRAIKNLETAVQKMGDQRRPRDHEPDDIGAKRLKK